jgi:hypothetical protein
MATGSPEYSCCHPQPCAKLTAADCAASDLRRYQISFKGGQLDGLVHGVAQDKFTGEDFVAVQNSLRHSTECASSWQRGTSKAFAVLGELRRDASLREERGHVGIQLPAPQPQGELIGYETPCDGRR